MLDTALDLVDLRFADELVFEPGSDAAALKQALLVRRAALGVSSPVLEVSPASAPVHLTHGPSRLGIGLGVYSSGTFFLQYDFRPALHDLGDPPAGYPETFHLEFLPARVRFDLGDDNRLGLERFSLVNVWSLNPVTRFEHDASWHFSAGATTLRDAGCRACTVATAETGGGGAVSLAHDGLVLYVTGDTALFAGPGLRGWADMPVWLGVGPGAGVRFRPCDTLVALATGRWLWLPWQGPRSTWEAEGHVRWQVAFRLAIDLSVRVQPASTEVLLSTFLYD